MEEWVEVRGKTAEVAIEAAMLELGVESRNRIEVEVLQDAEKGFLGFGGQDAIVKVKLKPEPPSGKKRRRRRKRKGSSPGDESGQKPGGAGRTQGGKAPSDTKRQADGRGQGRGRSTGGNATGDGGRTPQEAKREEKPEVDITEQAEVVESFLAGLVGSFRLEGEVAVGVEDDVIIANVSGPQTEAMVGVRGSTIEAIHELTKTVLHRQTQSSARLRLDIAGYADRRRQALAIYANQLIDQVLEDGGELTLEPMSAGDRKVIHDAAAAREGVRSYSEGESPQRYVVLAKDEDASDGEEE